MRILIVVGQDKIISGGAVQAVQLAGELRARNHLTHLVFERPGSPFSERRFDEVRQEGAPLLNIRMRGAGMMRDLPVLRRLILDERIEVIYAVKGRGLSVALLASLGLPVPIVGQRGMNYPMGYFSRLKYHHPRVRVIVAVSRETKKVIARSSESLGRKTEVVYQAFDDAFLHPQDPGRLRREFQIPSDAPVIGMVGNLVARKGYHLIVDCMGEVLAEFPETRFVFIGAGRTDLVAGDDNPHSERVIHTGFRTDVPELLPGLTLSVNPALEGEGLTGTTRESMAAGIPVIVSDTAGTQELIEDGVSGFVVPTGDRRALTATILRLLRDTSLRDRMGRTGRDRVISLTSPSVRVAAMERVFARALGSSEAP